MWRNYLTVGFRALAKNRTYAFINIFGLAIGLAACLMILLYVRYEHSYEEWMPEADQVFQIQTKQRNPQTGELVELQAVAGPVGVSLQKDFPQIETVSRAQFADLVLVEGNETRMVPMFLADEPFFEIIGVEFIHGDAKTALSGADSLVLSRSQAEAFFGTPDVLGRTVTQAYQGERRDLKITGIFEDLPKNSHMNFTAIAKANPDIGDCWGCINGYVYGKLRAGADIAAINDQLGEWERRNVPSDGPGGQSESTDWRLTPIKDVHLGSAQRAAPRPGNDRESIATFSIIALLILGMACINFTNLATARAGQRAREVALRKVLGARRGQLIAQFLAESLIIAALAMVLALALAELALPFLSAFLDADLAVDYLDGRGVLLPILAAVAIVGLAGGLYPAFYLSRFQPAAVLKANRSSSDAQGSGWLRNGLVIAQFAVSIGLIACTAIVYSQTLYAQNNDAGYRRQGLLQIANVNWQQAERVYETLKTEIGRVNGVTAVGGTQIVPATPQVRRTAVTVDGGLPVEIGAYSVDPGFFPAAGTELLAGRVLSDDQARDDGRPPLDAEGNQTQEGADQIRERGLNVVINRATLAQLGFETPAAAVGKTVRMGDIPATIVGVIADTRFRSIREPVEALMFYHGGSPFHLLVRFENADGGEVRERIGEVWKTLVTDVPYEADFAEDEVAALYDAERARAQTFAGFALLAVIIACLGLFGLAAYTAERRTKEIGIRKVLGARAADIVRLLTWQFSKPVLVANLIAWPAAWWLMRDWLNGFDARIDLTPVPFVVAGLLALAIAVATIASHALRVARANPIHALRYE